MEIRYVADQIRYQRMTAKELRSSFLVDELFAPGRLILLYTNVDRAVIGSVLPKEKDITLTGGKELASNYFAERREIGIINIGAKGAVKVDGNDYDLDNKECLYVGRGSKEISFRSQQSTHPAAFYLLSYPAHQSYPTRMMTRAEADPVHLGSDEASNKRTIYKFIHPEGIKSCQLVMGFTELAPGNVWNTMEPHTHERRTEVYMYFDLENDILFHFMGMPDETRHLVVRNQQAVISPSWSIHAGVGTSNYAFVWGMGGENQAFDDMDGVALGHIQ